MRQFGQSTYLAIKAQCRKLVDAAGGPLQVAKISRANQGHISSAISPNELVRFMAIDQIADLEAETGQPFVTKHLAEMAGYDLVPRHVRQPSATINQQLVTILSECGEASQSLAAAIADGSITELERRQVSEQAREAIEALKTLISTLTPQPTLMRKA